MVLNNNVVEVEVMFITVQEIEKKLYSGFAVKYRRFAKFIDSGTLWALLLGTIRNADFMSSIKFCNDYLKIPPVKAFLAIHEQMLGPLSTEDKQSIGAVFGFIFKDIYGYKEQETVSCSINTVRTATRFIGNDYTKSIMIGDEQ
jgi:hypothetical protein